MEKIFDEISRALFSLLTAGIVFLAWKQAYSSAKNGKLFKVLWQGFLWCAGIAFFAMATMGSPSCEYYSDPVYGGCEQYSDNGYEPTEEQYNARFANVMTLLYIPVVVGAYYGNKTTSHKNDT